MLTIATRLRHFHFHALLLIVFFLLNGYIDNRGLVAFSSMLLYFLVMSAVVVVSFFVFRFLFRSPAKAGIFTSVLLFCFLFYGVVQDFLQRWPATVALSRDHFLFPLLFMLLVVVFWRLRRSKRQGERTVLFINTLLLIFIAIDLLSLFFREGEKRINQNTAGQLQRCDSCARPDIYLIVLDEYWGSGALRTHYGYDNSHFEQTLKDKGFYVVDSSSSNYSYTPLSVASLFRMDWLGWVVGPEAVGAKDYTKAAHEIAKSPVIGYLEQLGYGINNYSIFDIGSRPSSFQTGFMAFGLQLITNKTALERVRQSLFWGRQVRGIDDLGWLGLSGRSVISKGNERMIEHTLTAAESGDQAPQFTYTHLMMPHLPYMYDSTGRPVTVDREASRQEKDAAYLQYLIYTNGRVEKLVNEILRLEKGRAVVVLLSDHGYRDLAVPYQAVPMNRNFAAVYVPGGKYQGYYAGLTNVNQFRVLLNTIFGQRLPMLKDSVVF